MVALVIFSELTPGIWGATFEQELIYIGLGTVEYWNIDNSPDAETAVLEYRSIYGMTYSTLSQYQEALRNDCLGLRKLSPGLKHFLTGRWVRAR